MSVRDICKQDIAENIKSLRRGVSHRAMILALAVPVMLLISPTGRRSARAGTVSLGAGTAAIGGTAVTVTSAGTPGTGTLKLTGNGTRINITGNITTGQKAVIINSGTISTNFGTGVLQTGTFAGAISNKGKILVTGASSTTVVGVRLTNVTNVVFKNSGTIKATVTGSTSANFKATGVRITGSAPTPSDRATVTFVNLADGKITVKATNRNSYSFSLAARGAVLSGTGLLVGNVTNAGAIKVSAIATSLTVGDITAVGISIAAGVATFSGDIKNTGKLSVKASGSTGGSFGNVQLAVGINNAGNKLIGDIINKGTIKVTGFTNTNSTINVTGVKLFTVAGDIRNSGKILVSANAASTTLDRAAGIYISQTLKGNFTNTANAQIKVTGLASLSVSSAFGFFAFKMTGAIKNSGKITLKASGSRVSSITGIQIGNTFKGSFTNKGTLKVKAIATASDARNARGFRGLKMTGDIKNSGLISVKATASTTAGATGITFNTLKGNFTNTANATLNVVALANTTSASASGFVVANKMTGTIRNLGKITVFAGNTGLNQTASAFATGINIGRLVGKFTNAGVLKVTATAGTGITSRARASGFDAGTVSGTIKNSGQVTVKAFAASLSAQAVGFDIINLKGNFTNTANAIITVSATGTTRARATGLDIGDMTGNFKNSGSIAVKATGTPGVNGVSSALARGVDISQLSGNFTNAGTVKVTAGATATGARATGIRIGTASGNVSLKNAAGVDIVVKATGSGTEADARAVGVFIRNILTGTLKNAGTISVRAKQVGATKFGGAGASATGILVSSAASGKVVNAGKITAVASMTGIAATQPGIDTVVAVGVKMQSLSAFGGVTNSGTIKVTGKVTSAASRVKITPAGIRVFVNTFGGVTGDVVNKGKISVLASAGGSIAINRAKGIAVTVASGTLVGNISNAGTIKASALATLGTANATGLRVNLAGGRLTGNVVNKGTISVAAKTTGATGAASGAAVGIQLSGSLVGSVLNPGKIKATGTFAIGIRVSASVAGNVINTGKITLKGGATGTDGIGIDIQAAVTGSVKNAGTIKATGAVGIRLSGSVSGVVVNAGGGKIVADTGILVSTTKAGNVTNSGAITATAVGIRITASNIVVKNAGTIKAASGTGIKVGGVAGVTITNKGKISASAGIVGAADPQKVVVNSGTIKAGAVTKNAIALGGGNDTVTIKGGKITGVIDGQFGVTVFDDGVDTLNFKLGAGVFSQNGEIRGFEAVNISSGTVILNNDVTNNLGSIAATVKDGARLEIGANLSIGNTNNVVVTIGTGGGTGPAGQAVLDLNNKTLTVKGNITVTAGAKIVAQITGTAGVAGGNVTATNALSVEAGADLGLEVKATGFIQNSTVFTIAKGGGSAVLALGTITDDSFVLKFAQTGTSGNTLKVVATRENSLVDGALTPNGGVIAGVLETLGASGNANADQQAILGALDSLPDQTAVDDALTDLAPDTGGGAVAGAAGAANAAGRQVGGRMGAIQLAMAGGSGVAAGDQTRNGGVWGQFFGNFADADQRGGINGYEADTFGGIVGADFTPFRGNENFRLGAALAYADTDVDAQDARLGDETQIDSWSPFLYATYATGKWFVDGRIAASYSDYDSTRRIAFLGRTANGGFDGKQYSADLTFGYNIPIGERAFLTPIAGMSYWHMDIDGFTETGAGAANQVVASQDYDYFAPMIGVRFAGTTGTQGDWTLQPNLSATVKHDFVDDAVAVTAGLVGTPSANFVGYDPADTVFNLGLGLTMFNSEGVTVTAGYNVDLSSDNETHNVLLNVRFEF